MKEEGSGGAQGSDLDLDPWKILWIRTRQNPEHFLTPPTQPILPSSRSPHIRVRGKLSPDGHNRIPASGGGGEVRVSAESTQTLLHTGGEGEGVSPPFKPCIIFININMEFGVYVCMYVCVCVLCPARECSLFLHRNAKLASLFFRVPRSRGHVQNFRSRFPKMPVTRERESRKARPSLMLCLLKVFIIQIFFSKKC